MQTIWINNKYQYQNKKYEPSSASLSQVFFYDCKKFFIQFSPPNHLSQASISNGNMASTKTTMNIDAFLESEFLKWDAPDPATFKHLEPCNVIAISFVEILLSVVDASFGNTLKKSLKE